MITLTDNDLEIEVAAPPLVSLHMVPIPPGTFLMGSPVTPLDVAPYYNEATSQPVHAVTITRPFWMGKYEVTQAQYQALMGTNPSWFPGPNRPVELVPWLDAKAFCNLLTVQEAAAGRLPTGYVYRLPTEAEWEYCCRAGTTTEFHTGPTIDCTQANFVYSMNPITVCSDSQYKDVGSYAPNAWGLHDMHGNVSEWCLDRWDWTANYPAGAVSDPYVASGPYLVFRGGGWNGLSSSCRSAARSPVTLPSYPVYAGGFRVVCAPILPGTGP